MSSIKYKGQTYSGASSIEDASHVIATDSSGNITTVQALLDAGAGIVELTQAQYDALPTATKNDGRIYAITDGTATALAEEVNYDNTNSSLTSTNVQDALDELSDGSKVVELTKAQYDALPSSQQNDGTLYLITDGNGGWEAERSTYDNCDSGLSATNVQDALDEVVSDIDSLSASDIAYSNSSSGLTATNAQDALDEVNSKTAVIGSKVSATKWIPN